LSLILWCLGISTIECEEKDNHTYNWWNFWALIEFALQLKLVPRTANTFEVINLPKW